MRNTRHGSYAAFFCLAFSFAQRARCVAAIFLRAAADIVRLPGFVVLGRPLAEFSARSFAHRAFCASETFLRAAADKVRRGPLAPLRADEALLVSASGAKAAIAWSRRSRSC